MSQYTQTGTVIVRSKNGPSIATPLENGLVVIEHRFAFLFGTQNHFAVRKTNRHVVLVGNVDNLDERIPVHVIEADIDAERNRHLVAFARASGSYPELTVPHRPSSEYFLEHPEGLL